MASANDIRRKQWVNLIFDDPVYAHERLFRRRHPDATPPFHTEMIRAFHSHAIPRLLAMAFRGGAKSTVAEETIALQALLQNFRNCVILCENQDRAIDRLAAIKYELTTNEDIQGVFGDVVGETWGVAKIILRNGVVLQAFGRGQEVRGMKHLDMRPDFLFCDDLESKEHVRNPDARHETKRWFFSEVLPACDTRVRVRMAATPLDREALPMVLRKEKKWTTLVYPIKYRDADTGEWRATWESRFPLRRVNELEKELADQGLSHDFAREYMCEPEDPAKKIFVEGMFHVVPRVHVWQPTFAFYDPARTTNERSSTTGWAIWSWIADRLVVWDGGGSHWKPDDLIAHLFSTYRDFSCVWIGVEEDGLNDWLRDPIRAEMLRRRTILPLKPMKAPQGKRSFIEGLQPFFIAGAVEFAKPLPELQAQFLNYPTGAIDGPNALAYAVRLRPGKPIYESFGPSHVVEDCPVWDEVPCWLAVNSNGSYTTAILAQFTDGDVHLIEDWVREGDAGQNIRDIYDAARLEVGETPRNEGLRCVIGPQHYVNYDVVGLRPAIGRIPAKLVQGSACDVGRNNLRQLLERSRKGSPCVSIGHRARWTLNALSAGYVRELDRHGTLSTEAEPGPYRVLMEGLESFVGLLSTGAIDDDSHANYEYTADGRPYKSISPTAQKRPETKTDWLYGNGGAVTGVEHFPKSLIRPPRHRY